MSSERSREQPASAATASISESQNCSLCSATRPRAFRNGTFPVGAHVQSRSNLAKASLTNSIERPLRLRTTTVSPSAWTGAIKVTFASCCRERRASIVEIVAPPLTCGDARQLCKSVQRFSSIVLRRALFNRYDAHDGTPVGCNRDRFALRNLTNDLRKMLIGSGCRYGTFHGVTSSAFLLDLSIKARPETLAPSARYPRGREPMQCSR